MYDGTILEVFNHQSLSDMRQTSPAVGTTYQSVLGAVINSVRSDAEKRIKQADIAKAVGVTVSTWSRIERGESPLTLEQLLSVALFLNFPLSKLFQKIEEQIDELEKQGIQVAVSKKALEDSKDVLQLSTTQLLSIGFFAAMPTNLIGAAAYGIYKALIKPKK